MAQPASRERRQQRSALAIAVLAVVVLTGWVLWLVLLPPERDDAPIRWADITPPVDAPMRTWQYLVIHHSASDRGSTASIDAWHKKGMKWDGIGYHFVIGNGRDMTLGRVDPTFRWTRQREGAHAGGGDKGRPYNQLGIGICLIGDFDKHALDPWEEERLVQLCCVLIRHVPSLSPASIMGHQDVPGKDTNCPGKHVDVDRIRYLVRQRLETTSE